MGQCGIHQVTQSPSSHRWSLVWIFHFHHLNLKYPNILRISACITNLDLVCEALIVFLIVKSKERTLCGKTVKMYNRKTSIKCCAND